jgi:hypothetical protein
MININLVVNKIWLNHVEHHWRILNYIYIILILNVFWLLGSPLNAFLVLDRPFFWVGVPWCILSDGAQHQSQSNAGLHTWKEWWYHCHHRKQRLHDSEEGSALPTEYSWSPSAAKVTGIHRDFSSQGLTIWETKTQRRQRPPDSCE